MTTNEQAHARALIMLSQFGMPRAKEMLAKWRGTAQYNNYAWLAHNDTMIALLAIEKERGLVDMPIGE